MLPPWGEKLDRVVVSRLSLPYPEFAEGGDDDYVDVNVVTSGVAARSDHVNIDTWVTVNGKEVVVSQTLTESDLQSMLKMIAKHRAKEAARDPNETPPWIVKGL